MMPDRVRGTAAIALLATAWLAAAVPVAAVDEAPRLGLTPVDHEGAYFDLTLEPGTTTQLRVEAANFGTARVEARTYAADVYSIINGGLGADLYGEEPSGTTLWLSFPAQEASLEPGDALMIDFAVAVPPETSPGEYITSIVIENVEPFRGSGSVAIDQVNRSAIAVAIDVPGARRPEMQIGAVGHQVAGAQSVLAFEIDNPGNAHLRPAGDFMLRDGSGREMSAGPVTMDSVYAGTATRLEVPLADLLPTGDYCAELRLADEETGAADEIACTAFSVAPTAAPAPDASGGAAPGPAPLWLPSTDVLRQAAPFVGVGLSGALLFGLALLALARRRRAALDPLRRILRTEAGVSRAWFLPRAESDVLAFEAEPGTATADGAEIAVRLQERLNRLGLDRPLSILYLQGAGPVERSTAGVAPFYAGSSSRRPPRRAGARQT